MIGIRLQETIEKKLSKNHLRKLTPMMAIIPDPNKTDRTTMGGTMKDLNNIDLTMKTIRKTLENTLTLTHKIDGREARSIPTTDLNH